jgi:hypothetical protein
MGFPNCSKNLLSSLIFSAQIVGAFTATDGDCQYVLLRVTVPPHELIASRMICATIISLAKLISVRQPNIIFPY